MEATSNIFDRTNRKINGRNNRLEELLIVANELVHYTTLENIKLKNQEETQ